LAWRVTVSFADKLFVPVFRRPCRKRLPGSCNQLQTLSSTVRPAPTHCFKAQSGCRVAAA
jgi:hypothetical protein